MPKSRRRPSAIAIIDCARDITSANKAPGGFGWGSSVGQAILDANEAILGGFYYWGPNAKNTPFRYGAMVVIPRSSSTGKPNITQIASQDTGDITPHAFIAVRKSTDSGDGKWGPWEWINPPVELGIEYRTTERYLGKPVYVKMVDFGALPNANYKFVGIENGASIIRVSALVSNGKTLPGSIGASQREQVLCMGSSNSVEIITYADASSLTATVTAWYTKTAD